MNSNWLQNPCTSKHNQLSNFQLNFSLYMLLVMLTEVNEANLQICAIDDARQKLFL